VFGGEWLTLWLSLRLRWNVGVTWPHGSIDAFLATLAKHRPLMVLLVNTIIIIILFYGGQRGADTPIERETTTTRGVLRLV
jgi:hypothetical protein